MSTKTIVKRATYLTFTLQGERYAVDVSKVREVLELTKITKVPKTPDFMRGVINLRGSVVPVIDLKLKFGMGTTEQTIDTCIVVMEVSIEQGEITVLGSLADSVNEVIEMDPDQIEPAPEIGTSMNTEFIKGMGKQEEDFVIILDIDRVFSEEDMEVIKNTDITGKKEE
jgi:purine-binding chemotaxis protein CheW